MPLIGPRTLEQLVSNLGSVSTTLTQDQLQRLDAVSSIDGNAERRSAARVFDLQAGEVA